MNKTILVVDDFASIRQFTSDILERKGYKVLCAGSGMEGYEVVKKNQTIDLVLTDYNMPNGNGYDLLRKIRDDQQVAKVPVVFLTTEQNIDKVKIAKEAGLSGWIKKPYRSDVLLTEIELVLRANSKSTIKFQ